MHGIPANTTTMAVFRKKRFNMEMAVNGNVAEGLGEPFPASKQHKRRRASLDMVNEDFTVKVQRRVNSDPGRSMVGHGGEQEVNQEVKKTSSRTKR